jgi:antitoxin ParD1/3/4
MPKAEKMSVGVTPLQAQAMRAALQAGEYASSSEIVRDALRLWIDLRERRARTLADLRQAVEEGLASGASVERRSAEDVIADGKRRLAALRADDSPRDLGGD